MTKMNIIKTKPVLSPYKTTMNVEAWIIDAKHILTPNSDNEYVFTFQPISQHDYGVISEAVMTALQKVERATYVDESTDMTKTKGGLLQCSQLFAPKLNKEIQFPEIDLLYKQVSLKIHLRDDIANRVFLQCDFCDLYEEESMAVSDVDWVEPDDYIDF